MSYKVLISDTLSPEGVEILKGVPGIEVDVKTGLSREGLKDIIGAYHGLVVRSATKVTKEIIESAENLTVIGRAGIGVDNIDVDSASRKGILVMNSPFGSRVTTAEHTIALMLALCRQLHIADSSLRSGVWPKGKLMGMEVYNKTLGIIGLGNIGGAVAERAKALGMEVIAYDPIISPKRASDLGVELVGLDDLFRRSDIITVHTPLTPKTRGMINAEAIKKMKPGVRIINCARGGIVNEADLMEAINSGKVAGAALDVYETEPLPADHPLLKMDKVLLSPHLGAQTSEAQRNVSIDIAHQLVDFFLNGSVANAVNFPNLTAEGRTTLEPYITLAERLGKLQADLNPGPIRALELEYRGQVTELDSSILTRAALKGALEGRLGKMNLISAPYLAEEAGVKVVEREGGKVERFLSLITTISETDRGRMEISGTLTHGEPRLVSLQGYQVEVELKGGLLFITHEPEAKGRLAVTLSEAEVPLSSLHFCSKADTKEALTIARLEGPLPEAGVGRIKALSGITACNLVQL